MTARIEGVDIEGLKSVDGSVALAPLTLVTGDIGSGKSRVSDAVRFAALGFVPALGRSESATAKLMRGAALRVRLRLSDGRWVERTLARAGSALRAGAVASWLPDGTAATPSGVAIRELFGRTDAEAAEHLDPRELLAATPAQRAARIEAMLDATAMSKDDALEWITALATLRATNAPRIPDTLKSAAQLADSMCDAFSDATAFAVKRAVATARATFDANGLADAMAESNRRKREASDATRRKRAARAEVEDRLHASKAPAATLEQLDAARLARTDRMAVLRSQVAEADRRAKTRADALAAEESAVAALGAIVGAGDPTTRAAGLRDAAARMRADADKVVDPPDVIVPALVEPDPGVMASAAAFDADADKIAAAIADLPAPPTPFVATPVPSVAHAEDGVARAEVAFENTKSSPWPAVRELALRVRALTVATPREVNERDTIAEHLENLSTDHGPDVAALSLARTKATAALEAARKDAAKVKAENDAGVAAYREAYEAWDALRVARDGRRAKVADFRARASAIRNAEHARVDFVNRERRAEHLMAVEARERARDNNVGKRNSLRWQADRAEDEARDLIAKWTAAAAAVAEARARVDGMDVAMPVDADAAAREIDGLEAELAAIEDQRQDVEGADALRREMGALATAIDAATADESAWRAVEWALQRLREMDMAARGGPIVDRMSKFLVAAGRSEVPFLRASAGKCAFGWSKAGAEIEVEALSGGETVLFVAALSAAILAIRKPEVSVLLLEAAEVGAHLPDLLAGCAAVSDAIGMILVSSCDLDAVAPDGWTHLRFGEPVPSPA